MSNPAANKALVVKAINELFGNRDVSALDRYWSTDYIQHDPHAPNGTAGLRALVEGLGTWGWWSPTGTSSWSMHATKEIPR
jgi:predicted SnoaL-like aldol condensation-catalyzing enzyme